MDRATRLFAVGPFASAEQIEKLHLVPAPKPYAEFYEANVLVETPAGKFLCVSDASARDASMALLSEPKWVVTLDAWNALSEGATLARIKTEHYDAGTTTTTWADRREQELARAGVLDDVALDWLVRHLRSTTRRPTGAQTKKEAEQRVRTEAFLTRLVNEGLLELAPDATVADIVARAHTILFVLKRDMAPMLERMFRSSTKVAAFRGAGTDLHRCLKLDGIRPH